MDSQDTLTNTVTATLTWQGTGPAPAVIVEEDAAASWFIDGDGTGTCSCGLPNPTHIVYNQDASDYATRYTFYPAPASGTTMITLPAETTSGSTTLTAGEETDNFVNLSYSVTPYPVTITLAGTTPNGNGDLSILVGQRCTASLVGIPQNLLSGTTYSWSISGKPLLSWMASSTASLPTPGPSSTTDPTPYWYWSEAATMETVTCTATVTPPIGAGAPFTLTITQQVNLQRPTYSARNNIGLGYIIHGDAYYLQFLPSPLMRNYGYAYGSTWHTSVTIPTPMSGSGQFGYAQIITPGEYLTPYGDTEKSSPSTGSTGLDTQFTYMGNMFAADGSPYDEGDSPGIPLDAPGGNPDLIQYVRLTDAFKTYLMFLPSGANSQWVPLAESDWHLSMGAGRPSTGHWSDFGASQYAGGAILDTDFVDQLSYPTWSQTIH